MKKYLTAILADLHGKDGQRWNVSHDAEFYLPPKEFEEEDIAANEAKNEDIDNLDEFGFECSAQPQPPTFKFLDKKGQYVLISDLKNKFDPKKAACEVLEMPAEEFHKSAICTLLGYEKPIVQEDSKVKLVMFNDAVKKHLGVEGSEFVVSNSPSKSPKSSPSSKGGRRKS